MNKIQINVAFGHICIQNFPWNWANNYAIRGKINYSNNNNSRNTNNNNKSNCQLELIERSRFRNFFANRWAWLLPKVLYAYIINNYKYSLVYGIIEGVATPTGKRMKWGFPCANKCDNFVIFFLVFFGFCKWHFDMRHLNTNSMWASPLLPRPHFITCHIYDPKYV